MQNKSELKANFKTRVYQNIIEFWDNYRDIEPLLCTAFEMSAFKYPDISLFAPSYSWQGMGDIELKVNIQTNGISGKKPTLNSYITELLNERIKIFYTLNKTQNER